MGDSFGHENFCNKRHSPAGMTNGQGADDIRKELASLFESV
jgi:hypothetical protein